jgi:rhamnulokinase
MVHEFVDRNALYGVSGLQFLPFNSLYQLAVDQAEGVLDDATTMLLIPDLRAASRTSPTSAASTDESATCATSWACGW